MLSFKFFKSAHLLLRAFVRIDSPLIQNFRHDSKQPFKAEALKSSFRVLVKFLPFAAAGSGKLPTLNTALVQ